MSLCEKLAGTWVRDIDMDPWTNIAGREWMTYDGEMWGKCYYVGCIPTTALIRGIYWHFPADQTLSYDK